MKKVLVVLSLVFFFSLNSNVENYTGLKIEHEVQKPNDLIEGEH